MMCRVLDIQTVHFKVKGPSGASLAAPPSPGQVPVITGYREVVCDEDMSDGDPLGADIGVPVQGEPEEVPQRRWRRQRRHRVEAVALMIVNGGQPPTSE